MSTGPGAVVPVPGWPAVVTRSLHKRFGTQIAVGSLDLDVPVGSFCGLVGPNGSGKTTSLRMIAGLLRPDSGQAWVAGHDTWADPVSVKRLLGVVPDPLNLFDRLSARELLRHLGDIRGMEVDLVAGRTEELLGVMDLLGSADEQIGGYSHGMRKKTAIAAALLHRPAVLLLDEPFEGVDPVSAVAVRSMLDRYRAGGGTVIFSSHTMDLVERMCDYVAVMAKGALLAVGPTDSLRGGGRLEDAFISMIGASPVSSADLSWLDEAR
ncbi:MAG TPA: ABC transporter ATP-binding protein [Microthrixaceae bacterium]|nr:ABC transporter ATP-binding protein [Microthrixaceae bacterium]